MNAQGTVAEGGDGVHVVADDDHGRVSADHLSDASLTLPTEGSIAHRHDFVDEQDFWLKVGGYAKPSRAFMPME